jgi:phage antirepressor YoqD-like protein
LVEGAEFFDDMLESFNYILFNEACALHELKEMFCHIGTVDAVKFISHLHGAFVVAKLPSAHGRMMLQRRMNNEKMIELTTATNRNSPRGSFAKKSGRKASNGLIIGINAE